MRPKFDDPYAHYAIDVNNLSNANSTGASYDYEDDDPYNMNDYAQFLGGNGENDEDNIPNESSWVLSALQQYEALPASRRGHISDEYLDDDDESQLDKNASEPNCSALSLQVEATSSPADRVGEPCTEQLYKLENNVSGCISLGNDEGATTSKTLRSPPADAVIPNTTVNNTDLTVNIELDSSSNNNEPALNDQVDSAILFKANGGTHPASDNFDETLFDNIDRTALDSNGDFTVDENVDSINTDSSKVALTSNPQELDIADIFSPAAGVGSESNNFSESPKYPTSRIGSNNNQTLPTLSTASPRQDPPAYYSLSGQNTAPSLTPDSSPSSSESHVDLYSHDMSAGYFAPSYYGAVCEAPPNIQDWVVYPDHIVNVRFDFGSVNMDSAPSIDNPPHTMPSDEDFSPPLVNLHGRVPAAARPRNAGPKGRTMKGVDGSVKNEKKSYNALNPSRKTFRENRVAAAEGQWGKKIIEVMTIPLAPRVEPQGYHKVARGINAPILNPLDYGDHYLNHVQDIAKLTAGKPELATLLFQQQVEARLSESNQVTKKAARHNDAGELLLQDLRQVKLVAQHMFPDVIPLPAFKSTKAKTAAEPKNLGKKRKADTCEDDAVTNKPKRTRKAGGVKTRRGRAVPISLESPIQVLKGGVLVEDGDQSHAVVTVPADPWSYSPMTEEFTVVMPSGERNNQSYFTQTQVGEYDQLLSAGAGCIQEFPPIDMSTWHNYATESNAPALNTPLGDGIDLKVYNRACHFVQSTYADNRFNQGAAHVGIHYAFGNGFPDNGHISDTNFQPSDFALGNAPLQNAFDGAGNFDHYASNLGYGQNLFHLPYDFDQDVSSNEPLIIDDVTMEEFLELVR